jgi:hypothetical protein
MQRPTKIVGPCEHVFSWPYPFDIPRMGLAFPGLSSTQPVSGRPNGTVLCVQSVQEPIWYGVVG